MKTGRELDCFVFISRECIRFVSVTNLHIMKRVKFNYIYGPNCSYVFSYHTLLFPVPSYLDEAFPLWISMNMVTIYR